METDDRGRTSHAELDRIRHEIDDVDDRILALVAHRAELAVRARTSKDVLGLMPVDSEREAAVVRRVAGLARARGLDAELVREIWWRIIELARTAQRSAAGART